LWQYVTEAPRNASPQAPVKEPSQWDVGTRMEVTVPHVSALDHFYVLPANSRALDGVQAQCAAASGQEFDQVPQKWQLVLAKFFGTYYRARVQKVKSSTECTVFFVDYGNTEDVELKDMSPCPPKLSEENVPPCAIPCAMTSIEVAENVHPEAAKFFHDGTGPGETFKMEVTGVVKDYSERRARVILSKKGAASLNVQMAELGYARLDSRDSNTRIFEDVKKAEALACSDNLNTWFTEA
jgi:endonuclease YncB( thermonuclease family)